MKLGSLITEVNILCRLIFLKNGTFLFQEHAFSLREHYSPLQNFDVRTLVPL